MLLVKEGKHYREILYDTATEDFLFRIKIKKLTKAKPKLSDKKYLLFKTLSPDKERKPFPTQLCYTDMKNIFFKCKSIVLSSGGICWSKNIKKSDQNKSKVLNPIMSHQYEEYLSKANTKFSHQVEFAGQRKSALLETGI